MASGTAAYYGLTTAGHPTYFTVAKGRFTREGRLPARLKCVQSGHRSTIENFFAPREIPIRGAVVSWHQRGTSSYYGGRTDTVFKGRMRAGATRFDGSYRFSANIPKLHRSCDSGIVRFSTTLYKGGPGEGAEWVGATSQGRPVSIHLNPPTAYGSASALTVAPVSVSVACSDGSRRDFTVGPLSGSETDDFGFPPNSSHLFQKPFISAFSSGSGGLGGELKGSLRWRSGGLTGEAKLKATGSIEEGESSTSCQETVGVIFKPR